MKRSQNANFLVLITSTVMQILQFISLNTAHVLMYTMLCYHGHLHGGHGVYRHSRLGESSRVHHEPPWNGPRRNRGASPHGHHRHEARSYHRHGDTELWWNGKVRIGNSIEVGQFTAGSHLTKLVIHRILKGKDRKKFNNVSWRCMPKQHQVGFWDTCKGILHRPLCLYGNSYGELPFFFSRQMQTLIY